MRELRLGEDVLGADGSRLGRVERLVVDEGAHVVSHLVVADRLVPLDRFRDAGPDGLATDLDSQGLSRFPAHDDASLAAPGDHWEPPEGYQLHNFLALAGALLGNAPYQPPVHADLTPGSAGHEITSGSPVWMEERRIGHVLQVLADESGSVAQLVIARDDLVGTRVLIPVEKVIEVVGANVHVDLSETDLELLEPYQPLEPGN